MVEYSQSALDQTFAALADPTRRAIVARLMEGEARVTEVAAPFDMSLNAVSKHLKVLERAGLVDRRVQGREHRLALVAAPLDQAADWIEDKLAFWHRRLDALEQHLLDKKNRRKKEKRP
ncbi:MAG: metalloregulator ArsR/SmtB family transcription factor [Alphaproteobacteria bacterium]|nr:metalloregulator ArsR/SmtB family transcription factor [Alphaproteobacteria bacterium]